MNFRNKVILFATLLVITYGCALLPQPDKFKLDSKSSAPIEGLILSDYELVDQTYDNELIIKEGGACSIKRPNISLSNTTFTVTLRNGDGLRLSTRTDSRKYKEEPGIVFEWTKNGSKVIEGNKVIAEIDSVKAVKDLPTKLVLIQDGGYFEILADCDTVIKAYTSIPGTEFIILESINSNTKVSGISFDHLYGFGRDVILDFDEEGNRINKEKVIYNK